MSGGGDTTATLASPSLRRPLLLALAAHAALAGAALRHHLVWGEGREVAGIPLFPLLNAAEAGGLLLFAVLGFLALRHVVHHADALGTAAIWRGGLLITAVAWLVPGFLSTDVVDYLVRGRVEALHGANPYTTPASAFPDDVLLVHAQWPDWVMPYGPISAGLQYLVATVAGDRLWLGVYLFALVFAACHVGIAWCVHAAARRVAPATAAAVLALFLWHPWLLLETAGNAHNDALMALFLAITGWRLTASDMLGATFAFGLAVLTKHGCAPLGPLLLVLAWRERRLGAFAGGVALSGLVTLPFALHYFLEPGGLEFLAKQTGNIGTSLQGALIGILGPTASDPVKGAGLVLGGLAVVWQARRVTTPATFAIAGARGMLLFVLLAMGLFSPWYHLWWLPLLGLAPTWAGGRRALLLLAWAGPASYVVFAWSRSLALDHQVVTWTLALALPAAVAWAGPRPSAGEDTLP